MSLEPKILARIDNRLRSELQTRRDGQMARVPVSDSQWAVWKRYCDMVGVSIGGGIAVLIDHELASVVEEDIRTLSEAVKAREAAVAVREIEVVEREEALAKRKRFSDLRERHLESKQRQLEQREEHLDSRQLALDMLTAAQQPRTPVRARPRPGRNDPCWCQSGKKYKVCHLSQDG